MNSCSKDALGVYGRLFLFSFLSLTLGCSEFSAIEALLSPKGSSLTSDRYIVVFRDLAISEASGIQASSSEGFGLATRAFAAAIADEHGVEEPEVVFQRALRGGVYRMSASEARALANDPRVKYVEEDREIRLSAVQTAAPWGLDRLDQAALPLDRRYEYDGGAQNVRAYVIDTGVNIEHVEFEGRAAHGFDAIDGDNIASDCNGHGTHVAGSVGGRTYGVAKDVKLVGVRVLDCRGSGSISSVVRGVEWVTANHVAPAVANMSLGGGASQAIDDAVRASIQSGVTYVVAAGNENRDACLGSPARLPLAITVGATTSQDARSSFSNYGSCVDIFAPGSDIASAWYNSNTATQTISGTSMASPHVAGLVARMLGQDPSLSVAEVTSRLLNGARSGLVSNVGTGSPNRLLSSSFLAGGSSPTPIPTPTPTPPPVEEPGVTRLEVGSAVSSISGATGEERFYVVHYPAGTRALEFRLDGTNGDADLYVRAGSKPSARDYDCRPYLGGSRENCTSTNLAASGGKVYVRLHAYRSYSGASLSVKGVSN